MPHEAAKSQLTPERWQQIQDVLAELIEVPEENRSAVLVTACGQDAELRVQLEDLLRAHDSTEARRLDHSLIEEVSTSVAGPSQLPIGRRIGAYRIEAEIARGGMGTVYRAVRADDEYQKQVAIKIVDHTMLSRRSAELFRHERQILASLEHPNIARLLDGGTDEDGSPYLVMEYVQGATITNYCDSQQLAIEERLKLFQKICSAVHFAHQNLVIHRDIKPANILVTAVGEPKLLDFGIAKIIDASPAQTQTFSAMTPAYASPEQLNGQTVTTATDIYSLGLVLYELLTGKYAYQHFTSPVGRQQAILEEEPERPSQAVLSDSVDGDHTTTSQQIGAWRQLSVEKLSKRLSGDLESIVDKAIRKEPDQRYNSVAQFSDDISRHLRGEPVMAHKSTLIYRSMKFVRRHRVGVATAAVVFAMVISGVAMIVRAERTARAEQSIADRRFNDIRKVANSLIFEVHDAIRDLPGATVARKIVVNKALEYLDNLGTEAEYDKGLQSELAAAYQRVGDAQGGFVDANLGDKRGALESYQKAVRLRESLVRSDPANVQVQVDLARTYDRLGLLDEDARNYSQALTEFHKSLAIMNRVGPGSIDPTALNQFAGVNYFLANALRQTGDLPAAVEYQSRAISIRESIKTTDPSASVLTRTRLAGDYASLADLLLAQKDFNRALQAQRKAAGIISDLLRTNPQNGTAKKYVAGANFGLGKIYAASGRRPEAIAADRFAAGIFEQVLRSDPLNALALQEFAALYADLGELEVESGSIRIGLVHLGKGISMIDDQVARQPEQRSLAAVQAAAYMAMGRAQFTIARRTGNNDGRAEHWREAHVWLEKSSDIWHTLESRNALAFEEKEEPAEAKRALSQCDAALARLNIRKRN